MGNSFLLTHQQFDIAASSSLMNSYYLAPRKLNILIFLCFSISVFFNGSCFHPQPDSVKCLRLNPLLSSFLFYLCLFLGWAQLIYCVKVPYISQLFSNEGLSPKIQICISNGPFKIITAQMSNRHWELNIPFTGLLKVHPNLLHLQPSSSGLMVIILSPLFRPKILKWFWLFFFSHIVYAICQQIMLMLYSNYNQNLTTGKDMHSLFACAHKL